MHALWVPVLAGALAACAASASHSSALPASPSGQAETPVGSASNPAPNECTSTQEVGFRIAYPGTWYSNAGTDDISGCRLFGPQPVQSREDPAVAIELNLEPSEGSWGPITNSYEGITILMDEETQLGSQRAWIREFERTDEGDLLMDAGDRWMRIELVLPGDWLMIGSTRGYPPGAEYEAIKAVLREMMTSIEPVEL